MIQAFTIKLKRIRFWLFIFVLIYGFYTSASEACADTYIFEKGGNNYYTSSQEIPTPEKIQYLYGILSPGSEIADYYKFTLDKPFSDFSIELWLSEAEIKRRFRPTLVFIDPQSMQQIKDLPISFPSGQRGKVYVWEDLGITQTTATGKLTSGVKTYKNISAGTYYLAVFDPEGHGGRYIIKTGAIDSPAGWLDKIKSLINIFRIKTMLY